MCFFYLKVQEGMKHAQIYQIRAFISLIMQLIPARQSSGEWLSFLLSKSLSLSLSLVTSSPRYIFALAASTRPPLGNRAVTCCHTEVLRSSALILCSTAGSSLRIRSHTGTHTTVKLLKAAHVWAYIVSHAHMHKTRHSLLLSLSQTLTQCFPTLFTSLFMTPC